MVSGRGLAFELFKMDEGPAQGLQLDSPWSRLVSTAVEESDDGEVVPIIGDKLSIGRKRTLVDLVIPGNLHVSGCHCILTRHPGSKVTLKDTSSNGTLLNGKRLDKNIEVEIVHNDVITIVNRTDKPRLNVAYRFENLQQDSTVAYDADTLEATKEEAEEGMEVTEGGDKEAIIDVGQKRKAALEGIPSTKVTRTSLSPCSPGMTKMESDSKQDTSSKPAIPKQDSIAETLVCLICQDILHDCVSLQPCMHSYCAGCYSDWMAQSPLCPACRKKVKRISKNHIVNNLVAAYLRANPDKARSAEDLQDLDSKNKITHDMLYPKKPARHGDDYDSDDTAEDYSDDSDSSSEHIPIIPFSTAGPFTLPTAMLALCPQCPDHPTYTASATLLYPYTCTSSTSHILCQCCLRPMPFRNDPSIPQKCELCANYFCSLYWNCFSTACTGCLAMLKEFNFQPSSLNGVLGNAYESNILKEYLQGKGLSVRDMAQACCDKLERGEYSCTDSRVTPRSIACRSCAGKQLKELAYQYRRDVPSSELPEEVTRRVDCYWGKECRTQYNKPEHAKKFNHVCEKTRQS